jgi:hypothetical protein
VNPPRVAHRLGDNAYVLLIENAYVLLGDNA